MLQTFLQDLLPFITTVINVVSTTVRAPKVNHKALLSTLRSLGIHGTVWEWFASYMDGCAYQVTWQGSTSVPCSLSLSVPQSSIFDPLLFSHYTNLLAKFYPHMDTTASAQISAHLVDILWMMAHQLKLNLSKTELLVIP
ncbi:hypothetical protein QTP70_031545, partial [Hemibagrus guttatus]